MPFNKNGSEVVMGIDILAGESPGKTAWPRYAVVVLRDGKVYAKSEEVPLNRLIRLVWEYRPSVIAVDDIYELGENEREIIRLINLLPSNTRIVQVTRWPEGLLDLREAAFKAGLKLEPGKLSPLKTAYVVALLAHRGYGMAVKLFEEKTKIIISKGSSTGPGGMSQNRYRRKVRASILRVVREIKSALDNAGIDYDLLYRKSGGGLDSAVFVVYAPRHELFGIVKQWRGHDVRVQIKPIYRSKIEFESPTKAAPPKRYIIVGYDPGMTVGVAAIDLEGRLLLSKSGKNLDRAEVISLLLKTGIPVLVATDKNPPPEAVKKLAAALKVQVYVPQPSLTVREKQELISKHITGYVVEDSHERDAIAAALKAFEDLKPKLAQVEEYLSRFELDIPRDRVKANVVAGKSIAQAVEEEIEYLLASGREEEHAKAQTKPQEDRSKELLVAKLENELSKLKMEKERLMKANRELKREVGELRKALEELTRSWSKEVAVDRQVSMLKGEVLDLARQLRALNEEIERLKGKMATYAKELEGVILGRKVVAMKSAMMTVASLEKLRRRYGELACSRPLYIENPKVYEEEAIAVLEEMKTPFVVADHMSPELKENLERRCIPVLAAEECLGGELFDFVLVDAGCVKKAESERERLRHEAERKRFMDVEKLLEEYRAERLKELRRA